MLNTILEFRKGILFVRLKGELTKKTSEIFEKSVLIKMKQGGIYHIVYNLEDLTKVDRYGYNRILYSYELCKRHSGMVFICDNLNEDVANYLNKHRILKYAKFLKNELDAFKEVLI